MKKSFYSVISLLAVVLFSNCEREEKATELVLKNNSETEVTDKPVVIKRNELKADDSLRFPVITGAGGKEVPLQLSDVDNDGKWDEIFFVANLAPQETETLQLRWSEDQPDYEYRTSARFGKRESEDEPVQPATQEVVGKNDMPASQGFQKYQTDGPTWENDKVGFRQYLDGRFSKDVFGKRTSEISPEDVGISQEGAVEDNYHVMEDWGRDILAVGNSVGVGGFGLIVNDTVRRLGALVTDTLSNVEQTRFRIQEEGPVKTVLNYNYEDWSAGGNTYDVEEFTTIWPGMYGFKNTVSISGLKGDEKLAVGLVNINNQNPLQEIEVNEDWVALISHDHQTYDREWILGLALILPKKVYEGYMEAPKSGKLTDSFLAKLNIQEDEPVSYYVIAGWELSQEERFAEPEFFKDYVVNTAEQLSSEIEVTIK